ncbi:MAG: TonB-dependent receptor [Gammaproteobacteria bacterium]|nr:TonB-dependent receptor [Gammaproteobacteria bacterium]
MLVWVAMVGAEPAPRAANEPASSAQPIPAGDAPIEEVVVTGSRIRRDPLTVRDSVLSLDEEDKSRSGLSSIGDLLARLPVSGSPLSTRFNSSGNFGFPADGGGVAAGASQVDLRHLGSKRVLVLVDGLRWVNGSSGSGVSGATDLNTIPASVVERIEVLRDGASAIYGSDAIAGVVNIITRKADGTTAKVHIGGHENGGETRDLELAFGRVWDATSASAHFAYTDQARVDAADHDQTRWPKPGTGVTHGSTFTPQGRVIFVDPNTGRFVNCALNDGVAGLPTYDPSDPCGANDDYHPWSNADRFNYAAYNLVLTPSRRTGVFARVDHEASETLRLNLRALFNRRESTNQAAPEPVWAGTLAESGSLMDRIVIDADNPYNPFGFDTGPGGFLTRRPLESGPRIFEQEVATRYAAVGVEGIWAGFPRALAWDARVIWSRNVAEQTKHGAHNARRMLEALGPPADCARIAGCTPLNLLGGQAGGGTITDAMLDWIGFVQRDRSSQTLKSFVANVTGELAALPAGGLDFAAGFERRRQDGRFDPDPVVAAGDTAGLPAQPTSGGYTVTEFYAELEAPLVSGLPGAELIDVAAAIRRFDYSTFDSDTTAKTGLRWRLTADLQLRASWAQGFRAPNIGELFGGLTRLDAAISDPCANFLATNVGRNVIDNCVAHGVPADGSYTQLGGQISVLTGGNERLEPETSASESLAVAWSPQWARGHPWIDELRVELMHYRHEVDDAITGYDAQSVLDGCYRDGVAVLCELIERNERGGIARFRNTLFNVGSIETRGWDFGVVFAAGSRWRLHWQGTHLAEFTERLQDAAGRVVESRSLEGRTESDRGKPQWKASLAIEYGVERWGAAWTIRYTDSMTERCSDFLDGSPDSLTNLGLRSMPNHEDNTASRNHLASTTLHDVQARYTFAVGGGDLTLTAGVNNLLDRDPPISMSASLNGYDASVYDIPGGRFAYFRLGYSSHR